VVDWHGAAYLWRQHGHGRDPTCVHLVVSLVLHLSMSWRFGLQCYHWRHLVGRCNICLSMSLYDSVRVHCKHDKSRLLQHHAKQNQRGEAIARGSVAPGGPPVTVTNGALRGGAMSEQRRVMRHQRNRPSAPANPPLKLDALHAALQARAALHSGEGCLCMFFCWGALLHLLHVTLTACHAVGQILHTVPHR
jgi:hypothetical protein